MVEYCPSLEAGGVSGEEDENHLVDSKETRERVRIGYSLAAVSAVKSPSIHCSSSARECSSSVC